MAVPTEEFAKKVKEHCYSKGLDCTLTYFGWIQWCVDNLCKLEVYNDMEALKNRFNDMRLDNPVFTQWLHEWMVLCFESLAEGECFDYLGSIYEFHFKSKDKAKDTGQFFTPMHACDLMAKLTNDNTCRGYYDFIDNCCGSGRMSIKAWQNLDHKAHPYAWFANGDLDPVSVNMCALNMLFFGMIGSCSRQNAITDEWWGGYIVNATKVPVMNHGVSLHYYDNREEFEAECSRLQSLMKDYYN